MTNDEDRLRFAEWVLERNLGWIAAAEVKVGVVVAIDTGTVGALAAFFAQSQIAERTAWVLLVTIVAAVSLVFSIFCAAMAVMPRVTGPAKSNIFFGPIAQQNAADYADSVRNQSAADRLNDCLAQVHRNAEIAKEKFSWVRAGMAWAFVALPFWVVAIGLLAQAR
jgi:pycsar effector protein